MPTEAIPYQSGDPGALHADERVLLVHETRVPTRPPVRPMRVVRAVLGFVVVGALFTLLIRISIAGSFAWPAIAVFVLIGGTICTLIVWDGRRGVPGEAVIHTRLTDGRVLQRARQGVRDLDLEYVRSVMVKGTPSGPTSVSLRHLAANEIVFGDGPTQTDRLEIDGAALSLARRAAGQAIVVRAREHTVRRGDRSRRWRPGTLGDTPAGVSTTPSPRIDPAVLAELWLAPLDGERVLWAGRPAWSLRAAVRRRLRALAFAAPWAIAASVAVASPFFVSWTGRRSYGPATVIAAVIGGLVLIGIFFGQIVTPLSDARRLRRTRYVLTDRRLITRVLLRPGQISETSEFFDDASSATLDTDPYLPGVGSVTVSFGLHLQSVPEAAAIHAMIVRVLAAPPSDPPVASPADPPAV